jgi:hypothetical protein
MGLSEQLREGAILERKVIPFSGTTIGSASFGATYVILDIEIDTPCRIRFYDDESSLVDSIEQTRSFGESTFTTDIALIADVSMSVAGKYTMDPVLYGVPSSSEEYFTYYRITEASGEVDGNLTVYTLEDENIVADIENDFYKIPNRRELEFTGDKNILSSIEGAPRTYLLLDAIADEECRLRIYADIDSLNNPQEYEDDGITIVSRPFSEAVMSPDIKIIADMELVANEVTKFYPKIIGANLQTLPVNLETIRLSRSAISSFSEIYYRLEPETATVNLNIYTLEN